MITGFVFVMMLLIEYINVQSKGLWQKSLTKNKWRQYLITGVLGVIPGCLGAFTVVALFSHRLVSFGALVTAMIATSGDEAFVMFSMFPDVTLKLTLILFVIAIVTGYIVSILYKGKKKINEKYEASIQNAERFYTPAVPGGQDRRMVCRHDAARLPRRGSVVPGKGYIL